MRHVGLLGLGQSLVEAPFADPSIEFWGMSNGHSVYPNWAVRRWFELHTLDICVKRDPSYLQWAAQNQTTLYMQQHYVDIPESLPFPKHAVLAVCRRPYLTSTVAWMLGMCLLEPDITTVSLWGINLSSAEEYRRQRPCVEYLLGRLEGRGVEVRIPQSSVLLKDTMLYGYEEPTPDANLIKRYAIGGTEAVLLDGVPVKGIWIDPTPDVGGREIHNELEEVANRYPSRLGG